LIELRNQFIDALASVLTPPIGFEQLSLKLPDPMFAIP
jgi:hypothetical protein